MWTFPLLTELLSLHGLVVVIGLLVYVFADLVEQFWRRHAGTPSKPLY